MSKYEDRLKDYITVDQRILAFYAKHPSGSIQSEITHLSDKLVVVKAWAYRDADDTRPGIGHSSMNIPGSTSFTRGSEVENAETSAWGRAIAALGFEVKRGIATREEIENKQEEAATPQNGSNREPGASTETGPSMYRRPIDPGTGERQILASEAQRKLLVRSAKSLMGENEGAAWIKQRLEDLGITGPENFQQHNWQMLLNELNQLRAGEQSQEPKEDKDIGF